MPIACSAGRNVILITCENIEETGQACNQIELRFAESLAMTADELIVKLKDPDDKVRTEAWFGAGRVGAPAIRPLSALAAEDDLEVARAAKRGLWQIVRHAGRPGAGEELTAVQAELVSLLDGRLPAALLREVLWMLSEIGGEESVQPIARQLTHMQLREDARMALERIPGAGSLAALKAGLAAAPDDFKTNMAQSLRQRGEVVPGIPCVKLVPTRKTNVKRVDG